MSEVASTEQAGDAGPTRAPPGEAELRAHHTAPGGKRATTVRSRKFGSYQLLRELGRGGMGVVFEARDPQRAESVALKLLNLPRQAPGAGETRAERLRRESEALARVQHPGVVEVRGTGEDGGTVWLAMGYVPGLSLRDRLHRDGPLPIKEAVRIARALAEAVAAAHAAGVLHRDLKPANVILRPDGSPVLVDFGLARLVDLATLTATGAVMGTANYMAPEQAGERADERTDVWGLGAVLYAMLTGAPPFPGDVPVQVINALLSRSPTPPAVLREEIPPPLAALVMRCLTREPDARLASAAELADELAALEGPAKRPGAPRALKLAVLAAGLLAAGLLTAVALKPRASPAATPAPVATAAPRPAASAPITTPSIEDDLLALEWSRADAALVVQASQGPLEGRSRALLLRSALREVGGDPAGALELLRLAIQTFPDDLLPLAWACNRDTAARDVPGLDIADAEIEPWEDRLALRARPAGDAEGLLALARSGYVSAMRGLRHEERFGAPGIHTLLKVVENQLDAAAQVGRDHPGILELRGSVRRVMTDRAELIRADHPRALELRRAAPDLVHRLVRAAAEDMSGQPDAAARERARRRLTLALALERWNPLALAERARLAWLDGAAASDAAREKEWAAAVRFSAAGLAENATQRELCRLLLRLLDGWRPARVDDLPREAVGELLHRAFPEDGLAQAAHAAIWEVAGRTNPAKEVHVHQAALRAQELLAKDPELGPMATRLAERLKAR